MKTMLPCSSCPPIPAHPPRTPHPLTPTPSPPPSLPPHPGEFGIGSEIGRRPRRKDKSETQTAAANVQDCINLARFTRLYLRSRPHLHWKFPRRLTKDMMWLATYVAISRVRKLANLRSVGLTNKIRSIIEAGPPESIPAVFAKYFAEKEKNTQKDADSFMQHLGWSS